MIFLIATAPSGANSGNESPNSLLVSYAWASASGDPRVPMVTIGVSVDMRKDDFNATETPIIIDRMIKNAVFVDILGWK